MVSPQATQPSQSPHELEMQKRFPYGQCLCKSPDPCGCTGVKVEQCPCYRHEVQSPHPRQGDDESVRITAQDVPADVRRRIMRAHYEKRAAYQTAVTLEAKRNRDSLTLRFRSNPDSVHPCQIEDADRQLLAARTVERDVRANLALYIDNREFGASAVTR